MTTSRYHELCQGRAGELRWSVLVVDVVEERAEALILALEALGLKTQTVLRDPDVEGRYFVHAAEVRAHDERSFAARCVEVEACVAPHGGVVADWSVHAR